MFLSVHSVARRKQRKQKSKWVVSDDKMYTVAEVLSIKGDVYELLWEEFSSAHASKTHVSNVGEDLKK